MKNLLFFFITLLLIVYNSSAFAFNDTITHPKISENALKNSNTILSLYFENNLMLKDGLKTTVGSKNILQWLQYGAEKEDSPMCRASNHFHDPYLPWTESGLTDTVKLLNLCWLQGYPIGNITSNITWATGYESKDTPPPPTTSFIYKRNTWDWESARIYYYIYLTGFYPHNMDPMDFNKTTDDDLYLAYSLRALGQTMHLLQDAAVPAHVRNDFSQGHLMWGTEQGEWPSLEWIGNDFEKYIKRHNDATWFDDLPVNGVFADLRLTDLWDTDQLRSGGTLPSDMSTIGLSEYASMNFFSRFTMFSENFDYPKKEDCTIILDSIPYYPNFPLKRKYISSIYTTPPGEPIKHLATAGFFYHWREKFPNTIGEHPPVGLDDNCHMDYAEKLIPRAIGYSSQLIDYFFRGRMQVEATPFFMDNALYAMELNITNTTGTQEAMRNGSLTVTFRYTPVGGNADGSDDIFVPADRFVSLTELPYNDSFSAFFYPSEDIPVESWDSVTCTLAFLGTLGNEEGAVVGQVFTAGDILFNEEWDNGLTGNHPWAGNPDNINPDNGFSLREIVDGRLIMENIQDADDIGARVNELWVDFDTDGSEGIPISSNTYFQFIINEMSNAFDTVNASHIMTLTFSDGLRLQFADQGPYLIMNNDSTAYLRFIPQQITWDNIYDMFQNQGILIPEPFYLKSIDFLQQLYGSSEEHHLRLEVDALRLIEMQPPETP